MLSQLVRYDTMRLFLLAGIGLLTATVPLLGQAWAPRPTATYTLVRNDDGTGSPTPKHWALYADVTSRGYAGIYAFGVDLVDASVTSIRSVSPTGLFVSSSDPDIRWPIGFSTIRTTLVDKAKFYAAQEMVNPDAIMEYSFGLRDGSLDKAEGLAARNAEENPTPWTLQDAVQDHYRGHLLLGTGRFDIVLPEFQEGSPDNVMGVFLNSDGRRSQRADLTLVTLDLLSTVGQSAGVPEPSSATLFALLAASVLIRRLRLPTH